MGGNASPSWLLDDRLRGQSNVEDAPRTAPSPKDIPEREGSERAGESPIFVTLSTRRTLPGREGEDVFLPTEARGDSFTQVAVLASAEDNSPFSLRSRRT